MTLNNKEKLLIITYLGPRGTFCEQAAKKFFILKKGQFIPQDSIRNVFRAVAINEAKYGVVPVENSLDGSVNITLDLLLESDLMIWGEVNLRIVHNLIVKKGMRLNQIKSVLSHAQALAQCRRFLEGVLPKAELRAVSSTAKAVELIRTMDHAAAIGTEVAANNFGLTVLKRSIEDETHNFTRFFVLGKEDTLPTNQDKTSLIFSTKHVPGSLYRALGVFATRQINLTKIESRPMKDKPWEYVFYLDFEGHRTDPYVSEALDELKDKCIFIKLLGSYPKNIVRSETS